MGNPASGNSLEILEIQLLLEGVYRCYGFDFREYALSSLRRRIREIAKAEGVTTVSALQEKVLHDPACWQRFLLGISVNVTAMFRNPDYFRTVRKVVVPILREQPFVRIWHAGCSTGEEVYSLAILLMEEDLYERCRIYATDINEAVLRTARSGIYPLAAIEGAEDAYRASGGTGSLSEYYTAKYDHAILGSSLRKNILFAQHNLVTDGGFNEFHLIFCRNVLIYFSKPLQDRVHRLLYSSLVSRGVIGLGQRETLRYTPHESDFEPVAGGVSLFRRMT
jgi:chemotaxis protein methyltransferase CheR